MINPTLDLILQNGIIAISRGNYGEVLLNTVGALMDGGIRAVEVTFEQTLDGRATAEAIRLLKEAFGMETAIGAGTVMTLEQLKTAYAAGADYIVSPNADESIIRETKRLGLVSIPGAMTPSEIAAAHSFGADIVKVFPAGQLGPAYFSAVTTPLSHIRCAAVGGVVLDNIAAFMHAGACAVGISSSLFDKKLMEAGAFERLRANALSFSSAVLND